MMKSIPTLSAPVAVGGVGGSGTRLIASILKELDFYIGSDLNVANDNLWFTLLFKHTRVLSLDESEFRKVVDLFKSRMCGHAEFADDDIRQVTAIGEIGHFNHPPEWLCQRVDSFINTPSIENISRWGWKEPNTHVVLDKLITCMPSMKYIHVARNGLDMAYSGNQNQLRNWGTHFLQHSVETNPSVSLQYWCHIHKRIVEIGEGMGKNQFLLLNYDSLCRDPEKGLNQLLTFLEVDVSPEIIGRLSRLVQEPSSIGRFKEYGLNQFQDDDIAYVRELGFDTQPSH